MHGRNQPALTAAPSSGGRGVRGEGEGGAGGAGEVPQGPRARAQEAPDGGDYWDKGAFVDGVRVGKKKLRRCKH